jgi:hypothetical protein
MINQDKIRSEEFESLSESSSAETIGEIDNVKALKAQSKVKALKASTLKGVSKRSARIGRPRLSRELLGLTRTDLTSPFKFNLGGASMTAVVGSRADQAGGSRSTRQLSAQSSLDLSAGGRHGRRSLSAEARMSTESLDARISTTKLSKVSGKATNLPSDKIVSQLQAVAPPVAPEGVLTTAVEKRIADQLKDKLAQHAARLREQQAAREEAERDRLMEEYIQEEVERRFR